MDEWSCAGCGRRLLIRRPPAFQKIVLEPGDEQAAHVGATGGVRMAGLQAPGLPADALPADALPAGDRDWLAEHGIEWEL